MNHIRSIMVTVALGILPLSGIAACGSAPPPDDVGSSEDALLGGGAGAPRSDTTKTNRPPPLSCELRDATCRISVARSTPEWDAEFRAHDCETRLYYSNGGGGGVTGGFISVCKDDAKARDYVASVEGTWAPADFCNHCLPQLPDGKRYVAWIWTIGPNCSGCNPGVRLW